MSENDQVSDLRKSGSPEAVRSNPSSPVRLIGPDDRTADTGRDRSYDTPRWLQERRGVGRVAHGDTCSRCGAKILKGFDDDIAAVIVEVDPIALPPEIEITALQAGLKTYNAKKVEGRYELHLRLAYRIASAPPWPALPEHRCGIDWPASLRLERAQRRKLPDECPF